MKLFFCHIKSSGIYSVKSLGIYIIQLMLVCKYGVKLAGVGGLFVYRWNCPSMPILIHHNPQGFRGR